MITTVKLAFIHLSIFNSTLSLTALVKLLYITVYKLFITLVSNDSVASLQKVIARKENARDPGRQDPTNFFYYFVP